MKLATSFVLLALAATIGLAPAPAVAADPVKFGFSAPLTSPIAFIAERAKLGTEYAVAELNARGGILGRKVEVSYGDTRLDPNEAQDRDESDRRSPKALQPARERNHTQEHEGPVARVQPGPWKRLTP